MEKTVFDSSHNTKCQVIDESELEAPSLLLLLFVLMLTLNVWTIMPRTAQASENKAFFQRCAMGNRPSYMTRVELALLAGFDY